MWNPQRISIKLERKEGRRRKGRETWVERDASSRYLESTRRAWVLLTVKWEKQRAVSPALSLDSESQQKYWHQLVAIGICGYLKNLSQVGFKGHQEQVWYPSLHTCCSQCREPHPLLSFLGSALKMSPSQSQSWLSSQVPGPFGRVGLDLRSSTEILLNRTQRTKFFRSALKYSTFIAYT